MDNYIVLLFVSCWLLRLFIVFATLEFDVGLWSGHHYAFFGGIEVVIAHARTVVAPDSN